MVRLAIAFGVVAATLAFAWWWRSREGRFTEASGRFDRQSLGLARGERPEAVLVEFFGEHCAPCITVQQRCEKLAAELQEVSLVRIDAGAALDLAERYNVRRVPTLFVTDGDLRIIWRASGVPSENAIRQALLGPEWAGRPHPSEEPAVGASREA